MQRRLTYYLEKEQKQTLDEELLRKLKRVAIKYSIQYALLWYIYLKCSCIFKELYRVYKYLSEKTIRENTVRKQL